MKIGIVSDTHDNIPKIKQMVALLNEQGVSFVLHAGDFVAPFSLAPLTDLVCDWAGVYGNNDGEREGLYTVSKGNIKKPPHSCEFESIPFTLMHTLDAGFLEPYSKSGGVVVYGHTHQARIEQGAILLINPGEVCGWITGRSSLVLFDTATRKAELVTF